MNNPIVCLIVFRINLTMLVPALCIWIYHYDIVGDSKVIVTLCSHTSRIAIAAMEYEMYSAIGRFFFALVWDIDVTFFFT